MMEVPELTAHFLDSKVGRISHSSVGHKELCRSSVSQSWALGRRTVEKRETIVVDMSIDDRSVRSCHRFCTYQDSD